MVSRSSRTRNFWICCLVVVGWLVAGLARAWARPVQPGLAFQPLGRRWDDRSVQPAQGDDVKFQRISLEQGLSQSSVFGIVQDNKGFMWFATQDGLNKFDGYDFTVYRPLPDDSNSLSHNYIWSIYQDREGILWIGTNGGGLDGLDRETGQMVHYRNDPQDQHSLSSNFVYSLFEDQEGVLWVGTDNGLNRFDRGGERFIRYQYNARDSHSLSFGVVRTIYQDREGTLWVGTEGGGLNRFDREAEHFVRYWHMPGDPYSLGSNAVWEIYEDSEGALWIGTDGGGLNRLDRETGRFVRYQNDPEDPYSLSSDSVRAIREDREGALWVGTLGGGLNRFDRETERFARYQHDLGDPHSLSDDWIWSIYGDQSGALWIGTLGGGVNRLDRSAEPFVHYKANPYDSDSLSDNFVWSIHEDDQGNLWLGTYGDGLDNFDRQAGQWYHYQHDPNDPHSLSHNIVRAVVQDQDGVLWVGTEGGGLNRLDQDTGQFVHYRHDPYDPNSLGSDIILTLFVDRSNDLWVGTRGGGLSRFDRSTGDFDRYRASGWDDTSLNSNIVRVIYQDRSGVLWVGTEFGLNRFDPESGRFVSYLVDRDSQSLKIHSVLSIYEDSSGDLWVGTFGGGLYKFDREREIFTPYRETDGLPSNVVYGILGDDQGLLWLSTNNGLSKFNPQTEQFVNYEVADGLQSKEFNAGAFCKGRNGELFFGGVNGFNAFYPRDVAKNPYVPPIVLTSLRQGGEKIDLTQTVESVQAVTLRWPNNYFEFEYAALSYRKPEKNQYAYILEGFDKDWYQAGTRRFGRYSGLPGGEYTLRIKGSNNDGVWNEQGLAIKVVVVPPFWQTWWFRGALILSFVVLVVIGYRYRLQSIHMRNLELEHQVEQRTREIDQRRQELEALYRADAKLHRHLQLDQVLQALVDIAVDILQADKSSVFVWDGKGQRLEMQVARGFAPQSMAQLSFVRGEGVTGYVADSGEPVVVEDSLHDPRRESERAELLRLVDAEGIRSFMHLPIKIDGQVFGIFNVSFVKPHAFGQDEVRLFSALAKRAALAIENAQLYGQTQELAIVEERNRLARDLHDAVTQTLFSASLIAEALPALWESDPQEGRQLLQELRQLSRGALAEMRTLLLELRPAALAESGLGDLLRQLAEAATGRTGVPVVVQTEGHCIPGDASELSGKVGAIPSDVHVALYRIAQEALNNVVKHAQAGRVTVELRCGTLAVQAPVERPGEDGERGVTLCISDDGRGFDLSNVPPERLGLGIMRERAQAVDAELEIHSRPGEGTRVRVVWRENER